MHRTVRYGNPGYPIQGTRDAPIRTRAALSYGHVPKVGRHVLLMGGRHTPRMFHTLPQTTSPTLFHNPPAGCEKSMVCGRPPRKLHATTPISNPLDSGLENDTVPHKVLSHPIVRCVPAPRPFFRYVSLHCIHLHASRVPQQPHRFTSRSPVFHHDYHL